MTAIYLVGVELQLSCAITDQSGQPADPSALDFKIKLPDGTLVTYTYGTDPQLVRDTVGQYYVYFDCTEAGVHWYRFEATGTIVTAAEQSFLVQASNVD